MTNNRFALVVPSCSPVLPLDTFGTLGVDQTAFGIKFDLTCPPVAFFGLEPGMGLILEG